MDTRIMIAACTTALLLLQTGCASYTTISEAKRGTAKVFSGTRLDLKAIAGARLPTKKFQSQPPPYPVADLPFSLALDMVLFPLTTSAVLYETFFD
jgi:uncharacterized protein YceK